MCAWGEKILYFNEPAVKQNSGVSLLTLREKALYSAASSSSEISPKRPYSICSVSCKRSSSKKESSQGQTSLMYVNFGEACDSDDKVKVIWVYVVLFWFRIHLDDLFLAFSVQEGFALYCTFHNPYQFQEFFLKNLCDFVYFNSLQYLQCLPNAS